MTDKSRHLNALLLAFLSAASANAESRMLQKQALTLLASRDGELVAIDLKLVESKDEADATSSQKLISLTTNAGVTNDDALIRDDLGQVAFSGGAKGSVDKFTVPHIKATVGQWTTVSVQGVDPAMQCAASIHLGNGLVTVAHSPGFMAKVFVSSILEDTVSLSGVLSIFKDDASRVLIPFEGTFALETNHVVFVTWTDVLEGEGER